MCLHSRLYGNREKPLRTPLPGCHRARSPALSCLSCSQAPPRREGCEGLKEPPTCPKCPVIPPGKAGASALPAQYADDTWCASPLSSLIPTPQFLQRIQPLRGPTGRRIQGTQKRINPDKTEVMMRVRGKYFKNVARGLLCFSCEHSFLCFHGDFWHLS